ncbi:hypothetical protein [Streptomyces sviceus]|uniref:hypothetical protein n=1 Tax=Streptomyces sviceus TaxID=285530 RepID=UPI0033171A00
MRVLTVQDEPYPAEAIRDSLRLGSGMQILTPTVGLLHRARDENADPRPEAGKERADRG